MFSLREKTIIKLCRAAFLLLCVAPTLWVLLWAVSIRLPSFRHAHEQAIANRSGLVAEIGSVTTPLPGMLLYEGLELSDPATGAILARMPFVEVRWHGQRVEVQLPYPAMVNGQAADVAWQLLRDRARRLPAWADVDFAAENLTLHLAEGDQTLTALSGRLEAKADVWRMELEFRRAVAGSKSESKSTLSWARRQDGKAAVSTIQLVSGDTALPCSMATPFWPWLTSFGKASEFRGRIAASEQAGRWTTHVKGELRGIDLEQLIARPFQHAISGRAGVTLEQMVISEGRIEQATGRVTAAGGSIGRSLLMSAATHLRLPAAQSVTRAGRAIEYRQLDAAFALSDQGLVLQGQAAGVQGALLVDSAGQAVLGEPELASQPAVNLAHVLVPRSVATMPAEREVSGLTSTLPVPSLSRREQPRQPAAQARGPGASLR